MGFFTELFSRPRPIGDWRRAAAMAVRDGMQSVRDDSAGKPADFPRIVRRNG